MNISLHALVLALASVSSAAFAASVAFPVPKESGEITAMLAATPSTAIGSFQNGLMHLWSTHPELLSAESQYDAAGYDIKGAYAGFLPYAAVDYQSSKSSTESYARFVLPLWRGGLNFANLSIAEASKEAALADLQRTRLKLGLKLVDAWMAVVAAREQYQYWALYVGSLKNLLGVIERRANEGAAPEADVMLATTRLRQADSLREQNRALVETTQSQLVALLGTSSLGVTWPTPADPLIDAQAEKVLLRIGNDHPEVAYAMAQAAKQQATARANRAALSPEVSLQHIKPLGDKTLQGPAETRIVVQYQTDNGLKGYQAWRGNQKRAIAADAIEANARREVYSAVRVAQSQRLASRNQIRFQEEAVKSADALVDSFLRQFVAGRKTWLEVLNAQRESHDNHLALVQQRRSYVQAAYNLSLQGLYWEALLQSSNSSTMRPEASAAP